MATIVAFVVAPLLSNNDPAPDEQTVETVAASTTSRDGPALSRDESGPRPAPKVQEREAPAARPTTIGVLTFNEWDLLPTALRLADARTVAARPTVDIIGWQEAYQGRPVFADLAHRGWETRQLPGHARELAVSWRRSEFALVSATYRLVAHGVADDDGRYPFGNKYVQRVTLRQRDTGRLISVINTHLPQKAEDLYHPGHWLQTSNAARARFQLARMVRDWNTAPGRWVVGTGDYNFDARADAAVRPRGGPRAALGPVAVSSYAALGFRGISPTHPPTGRYIDYVQAARPDLHSGNMQFVGQRVIGGLNSDHDALLARIRLR